MWLEILKSLLEQSCIVWIGHVRTEFHISNIHNLVTTRWPSWWWSYLQRRCRNRFTTRHSCTSSSCCEGIQMILWLKKFKILKSISLRKPHNHNPKWLAKIAMKMARSNMTELQGDLLFCSLENIYIYQQAWSALLFWEELIYFQNEPPESSHPWRLLRPTCDYHINRCIQQPLLYCQTVWNYRG